MNPKQMTAFAAAGAMTLCTGLAMLAISGFSAIQQPAAAPAASTAALVQEFALTTDSQGQQAQVQQLQQAVSAYQTREQQYQQALTQAQTQLQQDQQQLQQYQQLFTVLQQQGIITLRQGGDD